MADSVRGVHALQQELAKAKESLKDVDENIKKLTGRDPGDNRPPAQRRVVIGGGATGAPPGGDFRGRERNFTITRRGPGAEETGGPPAKRRALGGAFSRLGPRVGGRRMHPGGRGNDSGEDEEDSNKPTVQSSVVQAPKDTRTRQDMIREQEKDSEGKARNRRMFGLLLGTLQRFQRDAKDKVDKEKQRQVIERKLEERAQQERDDIRKQRQSLFNERKNQQEKLKKLEQKMELVQIHEEWEAQTKRLMKFIRTRGKPPVFYLPKSHNSTTEKKLKETGKVLEDIIAKRRRQLEEEINELTRHEDDDEMEHQEPMDMDDFLEGTNNGAEISEEHVQDTREVEMKEHKVADKENRHKDSHKRHESGRKDNGHRRRESRERSGERDKGREGRSEKDRTRSEKDRNSKRDSKEKGKRGSKENDKDHKDRSRRRSRTTSEKSDKAERDNKEERKDKKDNVVRKEKEMEISVEKSPEDLKKEAVEEMIMEMKPPVEESQPDKSPEIPQTEKVTSTETPEDAAKIKEEIWDSKDIPLPSQNHPDEKKEKEPIVGKTGQKSAEKKPKASKEDESDEDDESDSESSSSSSSSGSSSSSSSSSDSEDEDEEPKKTKSSHSSLNKRKAASDKRSADKEDRNSAGGPNPKGKEALVE